MKEGASGLLRLGSIMSQQQTLRDVSRQLRSNGMLVREVANVLGKSERTVRRWKNNNEGRVGRPRNIL